MHYSGSVYVKLCMYLCQKLVSATNNCTNVLFNFRYSKCYKHLSSDAVWELNKGFAKVELSQ